MFKVLPSLPLVAIEFDKISAVADHPEIAELEIVVDGQKIVLQGMHREYVLGFVSGKTLEELDYVYA